MLAAQAACVCLGAVALRHRRAMRLAEAKREKERPMEPRNTVFPVLRNDLLLRAAKGIKTERVPVWMMRQVRPSLSNQSDFLAPYLLP